MTTRILGLFALSLVAGSLVACKDKPKESPAKPEAAVAAPERKLYDSDLENVCNAVPEKRAAPYAKKPGEVHPLVLFSRMSESNHWTKSYSGKLGGWKVEDAARYQLVGCVTLKKSTKAKECKFDAKQPVRHLDLTNAEYEIRILEAHTGKELGKKTVNLRAASRCPTFHMFQSMRDTQHPDFEPAFIEFAKSFVSPKA